MDSWTLFKHTGQEPMLKRESRPTNKLYITSDLLLYTVKVDFYYTNYKSCRSTMIHNKHMILSNLTCMILLHYDVNVQRNWWVLFLSVLGGNFVVDSDIGGRSVTIIRSSEVLAVSASQRFEMY